MKEFRIYVDGVLVNVCHNQYALTTNTASYTDIFGKNRVTVKILEEVTNDKEKQEWLDSLED